MARVDLHLHTTASDGNLSPTELVRLCARNGLEVIAVTDHDSTESLPEALAAVEEFPRLRLIQGIELSTDAPGAEIHLLGYFVDRSDAAFENRLRWMRSGRDERAREMIKKLRGLGLQIEWERVEEISAGGAIGRPHIAQALVERGYVEYPAEAFDRYLGRNGPAYVDRPTLRPPDALELLLSNGAVPVLAHPSYVVQKDSEGGEDALGEIVAGLKEAGLAGMEVYYKDYTPEQVESLATLARDMDLILCGGTDYHASGNPGEPEPGATGPPLETVAALEAVRRRSAPT
jgi:predicted metal-dependent phosphoesterase TrpH